jgi:triosephosphate isomerase
MSLRRKFVAGNWKMNKTGTEARTLVQDFLLELGKFDSAEIVLCPPYTAITAVVEALGDHSIVKVGAQNVHHEASGAFTGEISATMLRDLFVRYVIIGHSERRDYFGETDELVNRKARAAFAATLRPIICVGEKLEERESGRMQEVITTQVRGSFAGFSADDWAETVVAYEPVWAIGTGRTATPAQAQEVHALIRSLIAGMAGEAVAQKIRILYGGSVKADNARELMSQPDVDGALVGGASLDARSFAAIVKATAG